MIAVPNRDKSRSYNVIDETTGEVVETISRRQYDKRFGVLARQGFNSYEARDKALKFTTKDYSIAKSKHHTYDLGLPNDLKKAIQTIIEKDDFGNKMFLVIKTDEPFERERTRKGKKFIQKTDEFGTSIFKKDNDEIDFMLTEADDNDTYGSDVNVVGYKLVLVGAL